MLKVGITGGIGSGKSMVCQVFETLGIPVFYADRAAKELMENDPFVVARVKELFGEAIYDGKVPNREKIAAIVFTEPEKLTQLNNIIHPAVIDHGRQWMEQQNSPYVIKEAAIFFESGSYKGMDVMIGVYAPKELRLQRATQRDQVSKEKILERMAKQMDEEEKMKRCDYVITNDGKAAVIPQVLEIHERLMKGRD